MLHNDKTEVMPHAKYPRVVMHCTTSVAGSFKQELDDDADVDLQECRLFRGIIWELAILVYKSLCLAIRDESLRKGDEATDKSFMDTIETVSSVSCQR